MKIAILLPTILAAPKVTEKRIFAPLYVVRELIKALKKQGHTVYLYSAPGVETEAELIPGNEQYLRDDLVYYQFRNRPAETRIATAVEMTKRDFENDLTLRAYKDAMAGKFDIMHIMHDFQSHYYEEMTGFPTVYTLHDPLPQTDSTLEYLRFSRFANHHYVSISASQRNSIVKLNFVKTVHHGVDIDAYHYCETAQDHSIFFGRLMQEKGADIALSASIDTHHIIRVATSMSAANQTTGYYKDVIEPLLNSEHVHIDGFLHGEEKVQYIGRGKVFIFPLMWEEPFGLTVIESMACGTPVIAFARGSLPELIKDGETGFLVNPSDADIRGDFTIKSTGVAGIREAIQRIYAMNTQEYQTMRKACRTHVEHRFSGERMARDYEEVYAATIQQYAR